MTFEFSILTCYFNSIVGTHFMINKHKLFSTRGTKKVFLLIIFLKFPYSPGVHDSKTVFGKLSNSIRKLLI